MIFELLENTKQYMKRSIIISATALLLSQTAVAETVRFAYYPTLSPQGETIYFSYDGDIFSVPVEGGLAARIINLGGNESYAVPSPDGKYIAFASDILGNNDVYVVPVNGGEARQLTYHEASDTPYSWSADSKYIMFTSNRASARRTTFRVAVDGGTPELMFSGYFNTIVNVVENPKTHEYLFNESTESINFPTRKRYVGDHNPNIKSWNPKSSEYKELTDYIGKDTWPMVDTKGNLYYVSDEWNQESNIVKYVKGGKPELLTKFDKSVQYPSIAAGGSAIVFLKDYQINVLNLANGKCSTPEIEILGTEVEIKRAYADQKPDAAAVSPDGKKFALVIRGALYVTDAKCKYLQQLQTPADERVDEVEWAADNKTVYFTRTNKGWTNLYKIAADGSAAEKAVFTPENNVKSLTLSNKRDKIVFVEGQRNVRVCDLKTDAVSLIANAEFWSFHNYDFSFSSDDSYLAFDAMNMFESDIYLYSFKDRKLTNLTKSASSEESPVFTPDGRNMYFRANPTATTFPRGGGGSLYKLPLRNYDTPFKSDSFDKLFSDEKESKDSTVTIDFTNIYRRMSRVERNGSQHSPYVFSTKNKSLLLYISYGGNNNGLQVLDLTDPEAKPKQVKIGEGASTSFNGDYFRSDNELYGLSGGDIWKFDVNSLTASKIDVSKTVEKQLSDEFSQMFYETWGVLEQNFYDVNFHGADWKAVRDYYASLLPYVRNRGHLRTLITDMLGELNSSHLGFTSNGSEEKTETRMRSFETGIIFDGKSPYKVARIVAESPADRISIDIRKGDELVAVNGERVDQKLNREKYFSSSVAADELKLTFKRSGKEFDVKVHTESFSELRAQSYREWEMQRRDMVEQKTGGRVAYLHMQAMSDSDLSNFLTDMHTYAYDKDALILDLRYNNGGNVHKEVIDFLRQQEHFVWSYRDFPKTAHPNVVPAGKPIVVLVNEHSLSDAEVTSNGIKTLGIAKLVGTETYRWIIFTSSVSLLDGSTCRMPAWGCYNLKGEDMENVGVKPDIYVKNTFKDRLLGLDPQLDTAIKEVLNEMK